MNKLIRIYNQNRIVIWIGVLAIIFVIVIIQLLNSFEKEKRLAKSNATLNSSNVVSNTTARYAQESDSLVSEGRVSDEYKNEFGDLINNFFNYCIKGQNSKAYELLSTDCKTELYPTLKSFEQSYCKNKFKNDKQFSFQSWTNTNAYVYRVKIFDDMLATGKSSSDDYIEEYVSIIEDDGYKLSVDGYIGRVNLNSKSDNKYFLMNIKKTDIFMEYSLYKLTVTNKSENDILLDTQRSDDTICLFDNQQVKYNSYIYELTQDDLLIKAGESKDIEIKFNNA